MIRIAIVEDERHYYDILQEFICRYEEENKETCTIQWFEDGMKFVENYRADFDLILMDIEMPRLDGISAAKEIRQTDQTVLIMFITNMAQYAIKGYEVEALDYVVKPLSYYAFALKLKKVSRILRERMGKSIFLPFGEEVKRIPEKDILYVEVSSHKLQFHTYEGTAVISGTLREVEKELDEKKFARCNSCYLVNLTHVTGIQDHNVLVEGEPLKMSRPKKKEFLKQLSEYYGGGGR